MGQCRHPPPAGALLDNDVNQIMVVHRPAQLSLPVPVVYYGDEIGMGDIMARRPRRRPHAHVGPLDSQRRLLQRDLGTSASPRSRIACTATSRSTWEAQRDNSGVIAEVDATDAHGAQASATRSPQHLHRSGRLQPAVLAHAREFSAGEPDAAGRRDRLREQLVAVPAAMELDLQPMEQMVPWSCRRRAVLAHRRAARIC